MAHIQQPKLPKNVGIIMDGNGRWAARRGMPRAIGHEKGVGAVRRTVRSALDLKIKVITLYTFSTENWNRPPSEVAFLLSLIKAYIKSDLKKLKDQGVKVCVIGDRTTIDPSLNTLIEHAESETAQGTNLTLVIAFNYGGRQEIVHATKLIARKVANGELTVDQIDTACLAGHLHTGARNIPDPDLIIRTGGEERISNFLLWQAAYAEFVFVPDYWPDFNHDIFKRCIAEYASRDRRFGGLTEETPIAATV